MAKSLPQHIATTAARLAQLQARQRLQEQVEKTRAREQAKRDQAKTLAGLLRSADAHRKIELGGVVIAAGADDLDPAELCGWLLAIMVQRASKPEAVAAMRERGLLRFAERAATKKMP